MNPTGKSRLKTLDLVLAIALMGSPCLSQTPANTKMEGAHTLAEWSDLVRHGADEETLLAVLGKADSKDVNVEDVAVANIKTDFGNTDLTPRDVAFNYVYPSVTLTWYGRVSVPELTNQALRIKFVSSQQRMIAIYISESDEDISGTINWHQFPWTESSVVAVGRQGDLAPQR